MKANGILGQVEHLQGAQLLQLRPCGQLINAVLVEEKEAQLLHGHQHSGQLSQSIPLEIKVHQIRRPGQAAADAGDGDRNDVRFI